MFPGGSRSIILRDAGGIVPETLSPPCGDVVGHLQCLRRRKVSCLLSELTSFGMLLEIGKYFGNKCGGSGRGGIVRGGEECIETFSACRKLEMCRSK